MPQAKDGFPTSDQKFLSSLPTQHWAYQVTPAGVERSWYRGVRVAVYGYATPKSDSTGSGAVICSYSIDGDLIATTSLTLSPVSNASSGLLLQSEQLELNSHVLSISVISPGSGTYYLDWFEYNNTLAEGSSPEGSSTDSTISSGPDPTSDSGSPMSTDPGDDVPGSPRRSSAGAIAGGTVGGLVLLVVAVLLAFWLGRRQRRLVGLTGREKVYISDNAAPVYIRSGDPAVAIMMPSIHASAFASSALPHPSTPSPVEEQPASDQVHVGSAAEPTLTTHPALEPPSNTLATEASHLLVTLWHPSPTCSIPSHVPER
ncbi:hypothetical protein C8Q80DRAFT_1351333 [Daedaleopsis nitida]|nr:hypothetical protein C8Q80DRAFT_1351333 [Daedaleopsis nitida]